MSRIYSCGQFEDSFKPRNLKIWEVSGQMVSSRTLRSRSNRRRIDFIANDRGHLLPGVKKDSSSPWGDVKAWVWEDEDSTTMTNKVRRELGQVPSAEVPKYYPVSPPRVLMTEELSKLKLWLLRRPPVLWILGQPQVSIDQMRKSIVLEVVKALGFTYLDMEYEIIRWKLAGNVLRSQPELYTGGGCIQFGGDTFQIPEYKEDIDGLKRAIRFSSKLIKVPGESLNRKGIIECLKLALAQNYPAKGYVIDGFPFSENEAALFEEEFYPAAGAIYFMSSQSARNPCKEPRTIPAALFRRDVQYTESSVSQVANKLWFKTIRVWATEYMTSGHIKLLIRELTKLLEFNSKENTIFRNRIEFLRDRVNPESFPPIYAPNPTHRMESSRDSYSEETLDEILKEIKDCITPPSFYTDASLSRDVSEISLRSDPDWRHLGGTQVPLEDEDEDDGQFLSSVTRPPSTPGSECSGNDTEMELVDVVDTPQSGISVRKRRFSSDESQDEGIPPCSEILAKSISIKPIPAKATLCHHTSFKDTSIDSVDGSENDARRTRGAKRPGTGTDSSDTESTQEQFIKPDKGGDGEGHLRGSSTDLAFNDKKGGLSSSGDWGPLKEEEESLENYDKSSELPPSKSFNLRFRSLYLGSRGNRKRGYGRIFGMTLINSHHHHHQTL